MKIRIISSREEINSIRPNERAIHLAFRPSNVDFLHLIRKFPDCRWCRFLLPI
jgi:hypothetical protein